MSADEASRWRWAAARAAGTSHLKNGLPCQDAWLVREVAGPAGAVLIAVVSDGAGSAARSREGSRIVVRGIAAAATHWFASRRDMPDEADLRRWLAIVRGYLRAHTVGEERLRTFAATVVGVFATDSATLVFHVGDGACALAEGDQWLIGSWPENGEYANMTFFVTDPGGPRLRMSVIERRIDGIALLTDGMEDLGLQRVERQVSPRFFGPMLAPVRAAAGTGIHRDLSRSLRSFLRSDRVNAETDDDKTLVLAAREP